MDARTFAVHLLLNDIPPEILASEPEMRALRQDIHAHPELGFEEHRTSDLVAFKLGLWGYEVHRGLGGTGVVAKLRHGGSDRSIGLRADMDALPIQEQSGLSYASRHSGCMHACGHDGHTAMLLMAARHLAATRCFDGTVHLIFQPAEEGLGGAHRMLQEGLLEEFPCDGIYAMHNMPGYPTGMFGIRPGPFTASADSVTLVVRGRGGHGAMPAETVDPIVAGSAIVMALQTVVSRNLASTDSAVITVGTFHSGQRRNVIPDEARLELTVRAHDSRVREKVLRRIAEVAQAQAQTFGAFAEFHHEPKYPVLVNHARESEIARNVVRDWLGEEALIGDLPMQSGSEDFAFMLEKIPGCYLIIGNGIEGSDGRLRAPLHNATYDFNDDCLPVGAAFWVHLVQTCLSEMTA